MELRQRSVLVAVSGALLSLPLLMAGVVVFMGGPMNSGIILFWCAFVGPALLLCNWHFWRLRSRLKLQIVIERMGV